MQKPSRSGAILLLFSGSLALMSVACSAEKPKIDTGSKSEPAATAAPVATTPSSQKKLPAKDAIPSSQIDTYELALDKAASAVSFSQSAQSTDDWKLVSSRWQEAIKLLKAVPDKSPNKAQAKTKLAQYQKNLATANRKANPPAEPLIAVDPNVQIKPVGSAVKSNQRVFRAPIIGRVGGTPVIEVTFNGGQKFPMILDTGASGVVITPQMASALGVRPIGKVLAHTPSQKAAQFDVGFVDSISVSGAVLTDVPVAIAPQLDIGLLGQDFFSSYDVTIRSNVVEFHVR